MTTPIPLIVHLTYCLDFGGLETLLVECINRMPSHKYRHAIVCLTDYTDFAKKISRPDVEIYSLHKRPGLGLNIHLKLWKLLRKLSPSILHTYNLSTVEYAVTAAIAGVPVRVHAEHGRDASDPEGRNRKHNLLRRLTLPFIDRFIPVSEDLRHWLKTTVGVPDSKNTMINNGVNTAGFVPADKDRSASDQVAHRSDQFVIGTVGRVQDVKNHLGLIDAFIRLLALKPLERTRLRLAIVGDGPLLPALKEKVHAAGIEDLVWLPGARNDIAQIMQTFSVFALSSIAEGTPVTILEAMSAGLPVVSTRVGGVPDVVLDNVTGALVPPADPVAFAAALASYHEQPALATLHGAAGRERIQQHYSMDAMLSSYTDLYDALCEAKLKLKEPVNSCAE